MELIDWIILSLYFVGIVFIIWKAQRVKSIEDFAVASRGIPGVIVFATLTASIVGPGYTVGLSSKGFGFGYVFYFVCLAFCIQTIFTGLFIAPKLQRYTSAYTIGDIFEIHYGKWAKYIAGIMSFLYCAGIVGVVAKASGDLINYFTGLDFVWAVVLSTLVVVFYSTHGGIKAVVLTDVIQFSVLTVFVPLILLFGIGADGDKLDFTGLYNVVFPEWSSGLSGWMIAGLFVSFLLGEALVPPYVTRALMADSPKSARTGFVMSGVFMVFWYFLVISIGVVGRLLFGDSSSPDIVFFDMLTTYAPTGILGLVAAATISVIMSTKDSFLNTASVVVSFDFLKGREMSAQGTRRVLRQTQFINVVTGVLAVSFALTIPNLIDAIVQVFTYWAPSVVLPLMLCIVMKHVYKMAGLAALVSGIMVTSAFEMGFLPFDTEVPSVIAGIVANQLAFWSVHFWCKISDKTRLA